MKKYSTQFSIFYDFNNFQKVWYFNQKFISNEL